MQQESGAGGQAQGLRGSLASAGYQDSEDAFPFKMYNLLEDAERLGFSDTVSWVQGGAAFMVHDRDKFTSLIAPLYFSHSKFKSFQRQLNFYQFERSQSGQLKGAYSHHYFIRGKRRLCHLITRGPSSTTRRSPGSRSISPAPAKATEQQDGSVDYAGGLDGGGAGRTISPSFLSSNKNLSSSVAGIHGQQATAPLYLGAISQTTSQRHVQSNSASSVCLGMKLPPESSTVIGSGDLHVNSTISGNRKGAAQLFSEDIMAVTPSAAPASTGTQKAHLSIKKLKARELADQKGLGKFPQWEGIAKPGPAQEAQQSYTQWVNEHNAQLSQFASELVASSSNHPRAASSATVDVAKGSGASQNMTSLSEAVRTNSDDSPDGGIASEIITTFKGGQLPKKSN